MVFSLIFVHLGAFYCSKYHHAKISQITLEALIYKGSSRFPAGAPVRNRT